MDTFEMSREDLIDRLNTIAAHIRDCYGQERDRQGWRDEFFRAAKVWGWDQTCTEEIEDDEQTHRDEQRSEQVARDAEGGHWDIIG